jgi:hypothetical protein
MEEDFGGWRCTWCVWRNEVRRKVGILKVAIVDIEKVNNIALPGARAKNQSLGGGLQVAKRDTDLITR